MTSHFLGNNVGPKDYEIAAKLSILNSDNGHYYYKNQKMFQSLSAMTFLIVSVGIFTFFYKTKYEYQMRSRDFVLSDINGFRENLYRNSYESKSLYKGNLKIEKS